MGSLTTIRLRDELYMIDDGICHCYLVVGTEKALLLDTGVGIGDVREAAEAVTKLPLTLVISHEHIDHLGGVKSFDEAYISPLISDCLPKECRALSLNDGDLFDLGGVTLEAVYQPGHSVGEMSLLNREAGYMLTGDCFESEKSLLHCDTSSIEQYHETLKSMLELKDVVKDIYPAHLEYPLHMDLIERTLNCVEAFLTGEYEPEPLHFVVPGKERWIHQFTYEGATITMK